MNLRDIKTTNERREAVEGALHVALPAIGSFTIDESVASTKNCENMIGAVQVPVGIAGPLRFTDIDSDETQEYYIPLATTEGALVASVNRGCKAISQSNTGLARSKRTGSTRAPVFRVKNLREQKKLSDFLHTHLEDLQRVAALTSHHLTLIRIHSRGVGNYRYVRFMFDTEDAMGMNMGTIASTALVAFIEEQTGAKCVSVAGNFDVDKKPSWLNFIETRGIKAWAEVTIPKQVLRDVLKATARQVYDVWLSKCMIGSGMSGSMGFNAQYANIVAALFIATGQDPAHVVEGSMGMTTAEVVNGDDLYVSVYLPDLMVGTVGGGTGLATQKEALSILGVAGGNEGKNAERFATITAAVALAGEISLLSSLQEGTLAKAHTALARGK